MSDIEMTHCSSLEVGAHFAKCFQEVREEQESWEAEMRKLGVAATHPNDGWIDRRNQIADLTYPKIFDWIEVGSHLALGDPHGHLIVEVVEILPEPWLSARPKDPAYRNHRYRYEIRQVAGRVSQDNRIPEGLR